MKQNQDKIFIQNRQKPIHLFDLWGVIVNSMEAGLGVVNAIKENAYWDFEARHMGTEKTIVDADAYVAEICDNYKKVLTGELTGAEKKEALKMGHMFASEPKLDSYENCFYQDALDAMRDILNSGELVAVYSNDIRPWVKREMPRDIAERVTAFYEAGPNGKTSEDFQRIFELSQRRIVSHTADQLQELEAALKSGILDGNHLVYVDRNGQLSEAKVKEAGIMNYVSDLRKVDYRGLK